MFVDGAVMHYLQARLHMGGFHSRLIMSAFRVVE